MTPTKEELASKFISKMDQKYNQIELANMPTIIMEESFLAGFQKSEEMHKELLLECEAFLAKHSRDVDILIQPEKSVIEASKLLQKIRIRE